MVARRGFRGSPSIKMATRPEKDQNQHFWKLLGGAQLQEAGGDPEGAV